MKYYDEMGKEVTSTVDTYIADNAEMKLQITQLKTLIVDDMVREKQKLKKQVAQLKGRITKLDKERTRLRDKTAVQNRLSLETAKNHKAEKQALTKQVAELTTKLEKAQGQVLEFK